MTERTRVVVALSGGVDSSVAAALLVQAGYDVVGITLRLRPCGDGTDPRSCCGVDGEASARSVAGRLGFPHYTLDVRGSFEVLVLRPAWEAYAAGRTPNPCVGCNRDVKFGLLMQRARALGADLVATGHHARVEIGPEGEPVLLRGRDAGKDQSYFLFALGRERLARALFPVGGMTKDEVRALAADLHLASADRPDSQDACIASRDGFAEALRRELHGEARPGRIVDASGRLLGPHPGIHRFTVGQRKGTGVALGHPAWVRSIDAADGTVVLTEDPADLRAEGLVASGLTWLKDPPAEGFACTVQVRYRAPAVPATVDVGEGATASVRFERPVRAVTPGQAVVFYDGDRVLGGGWIDRAP